MDSAWVVPAALAAGFFGSTHCIGMCGAVVVLLEKTTAGGQPNWFRRSLYQLGRLCFYALLGAVAATGGSILTKATGVNMGLLLLRAAAAFLVIAIGLNLLFGWSFTGWLERAGGRLWQRLAPLTRYVLPANTGPRALAAGVLWGALPCGLVYSAVALASTSGNALEGATIMGAFWLGTLPALLAAGASAARIALWKSNRLFRWAAGAVLLVVGVFALHPLHHAFMMA